MLASPHELSPPLVFAPLPQATSTPESPSSGSSLLFGEAARHFGVELTEADYAHWVTGLTAAMHIDHLIDDEKANIPKEFKDLVLYGSLRDDLNAENQIRIIQHMTDLDAEGRKAIFDKVNTVDELTKAFRDAKTAKEAVEIRMTEADILTSILELPTDGLNDSKARIIFNAWISGWSRGGYAIDTYLDRHEDYKNMLSGVKPTSKTTAVYAASAVAESYKAIRRTPVQLIGQCALVATKYLILDKRIPVSN